jgi:hypothetical protein
MKRLSTLTFQGSIFLGLQSGYTDTLIDKKLVIETLNQFQSNLIKVENIFLSASVSECTIVLNQQNEPHLKIEFINYPKFPLEESKLKELILNLAKLLMIEFNQNRIVVVFTDETIMLEVDEKIDPKILNINKNK